MVQDTRTKTFSEPNPYGPRLDETSSPGIVVLYTEEASKTVAGVYPAVGKMSIGRDPGQDIFVDDPMLSRCHATFEAAKTGTCVRDQNSHNGTFVNGSRVEQAEVAANDIVRCGNTILLFVGNHRDYANWPESARNAPLLGGPAIDAIRRDVALLAPKNVDILIGGETGTGKEIVAQLLHDESGRRGAFVPLNCSAVPASLFEVELFGAKRGAYTDASDRKGLFQTASKGTLFLDEVGELPLELQPKLLRAIEQREVRPVGADRPTTVDVRIVCATHRDLRRAVESGAFREDLYYRISGAAVQIPPLRERREDILLLAQHLVDSVGFASSAPPKFSTLFVESLLLSEWSGNVRALQHALREALLAAARERCDVLQPQHLPRSVGEGDASDDTRQQLRDVLSRCQGNVSHAAGVWGVGRGQFYKLLKMHNVSPKDFKA